MMFLLFTAFAAACTPVNGPMILGSDIAAADPAFSSIPAGSSLGYAPSPGSRRILSAGEVGRLALRFGIETAPREICFEYRMTKLDRADISKAMQSALPGARVEILEAANFPVPEGKLVFSLPSLPKPPQSSPDEPVVWRGYVEYASGRRFTIWAKVKISLDRRRVFTTTRISAGAEIAVANLEERTVSGFPEAGKWAERVDDLIGKRAAISLEAGSPIPLHALHAAGKTVMRGDSVTVNVDAGAAQLQVVARAESDGALGEIVKLRNTKSGKTFQAEVTGKNTALLIATETAQ